VLVALIEIKARSVNAFDGIILAEEEDGDEDVREDDIPA
jgi:hypothetical protein